MAVANKINLLRSRLRRFGWSVADAVFETLTGSKIYVVFCKRDNQSFSVKSSRRSDAWQSAGRLCQQYQPTPDPRPVIVRYPRAKWRS
jgi:hypothetical protein